MVTSGVYTQRCTSFDVFISSKQDVPTHLQYGGTQLPTFCHICAKGINMCTLIHAEAHGYEITTLHTHIHAPVKTRPAASSIVAFFFCCCCHASLPFSFFDLLFSPTQNVDKWSFDVFALNEASGDHALKFIFYELLTRYDLISRFKVKQNRHNAPLVITIPSVCVIKTRGD